ncbi:ABC transporter substrate-binding protein [Roseospirillum parvum]|uniref:Branched-chain amino acid transport system substrate-binding protein n=1 Tax=Roseospirillum parvum TaxID=83401 RepID=A0A1G7U3U0_9PROT|nr:ABC transporter substrate-binding protein [Roseospirillum parvum]SDG42107.1 branched-chain amino acid transport system substrate-binding protein [Roseospirillum parvum]
MLSFVRKTLLLGLAVVAGATASHAADPSAEPVRIGEINSYARLGAFTEPYRKGWELAVQQINAAGGVLGGRPLEVISRDDNASPADALRAAGELLNRHQVDLLAGTFLSNVGLAVSDFAAHNKVLFVAAEPLTDAMIWEKGNHYTFRLRPSTYMQTAMLVAQAKDLPVTRWATVAPNYEYGQSAVRVFKTLMSEARPDVEFVAEQWPALFKLDAGATVAALEAAQPEAIFNVTFSADLGKFVREGTTRGLFEGREVVSLLSGEPEYLEPLGAETPAGWLVTGYPVAQIDTPEHRAFVEAYQAAYGELPKMGSMVGYNTFVSIAAMLDAAGDTDTETMIAALEGLEVKTPLGPITWRESDHQSTMGAWVGRLEVKDGAGRMADWSYVPGEAVLPPASAVEALRPSGQ